MTAANSSLTTDHALAFLSGGGVMGELIRQYPWHQSELGAPEYWPQPLKTAVRILLATGHPMFIWWGPNLIQFYNDAFSESLGPERHPSALGQHGRDCWEETWHIIGPQIEHVMTGKGHTWNENQLVPITRHGRTQESYWTYSHSPIHDPDAPHHVGGVLAMCTETTETVVAKRHHALAEQRWRSLFNQASSFLCILRGADFVFEYVNDRYLDLVGRRPLLGKTVAEALPEVIEQGFVQLLEQVYTSGEPYQGFAIPVQLSMEQNGTEQRFVDFVYQPIRDENDRVTGIMVNGSDVTERERASEQMRLANRRKDEFLAMLSHELRNPLAPIRNAAELLVRTSEPDSEQRATGELIARQVTHLTRLVEDLLDVSRITQQKIELQREAVLLDNALRLAIDTLHEAADQKQLTLTYLPWPEDLYIHADLSRIAQCFTNVLANAVKYSDIGGTVEVDVQADDEQAIITISDAGIGIPAEILPHVFELFVQAEHSLDRAGGGLGIGLSVVQRLVTMHGGSIRAESAGAGCGARFIFKLPLTSPPVAAAKPVVVPAAASKSILVVDDNRDAADSLRQLLELEGHKATVVYDPYDALAVLQSTTPDVVMLDIGLPGMDGYQLAQQLRAQGFPNLLIAVTGYGQPSDLRKAFDAGFDKHIVKPVAFAALTSLLR